MLSEENIRKINKQIEKELRTVDNWMSDDDDKNAALKRIAKLKSLLEPQPSRKEILRELADAIVNAETPQTADTRTPHASELLVDLVSIFRR